MKIRPKRSYDLTRSYALEPAWFRLFLYLFIPIEIEASLQKIEVYYRFRDVRYIIEIITNPY